jgi:hypothetical protein
MKPRRTGPDCGLAPPTSAGTISTSATGPTASANHPCLSRDHGMFCSSRQRPSSHLASARTTADGRLTSDRVVSHSRVGRDHPNWRSLMSSKYPSCRPWCTSHNPRGRTARQCPEHSDRRPRGCRPLPRWRPAVPHGPSWRMCSCPSDDGPPDGGESRVGIWAPVCSCKSGGTAAGLQPQASLSEDGRRTKPPCHLRRCGFRRTATERFRRAARPDPLLPCR